MPAPTKGADKERAHQASGDQPMAQRLLQTFREMDREKLDLHTLFETAGNNPEERMSVLDAVEKLISDSLIESAGGDFYRLTERGKAAMRQG